MGDKSGADPASSEVHRRHASFIVPLPELRRVDPRYDDAYVRRMRVQGYDVSFAGKREEERARRNAVKGGMKQMHHQWRAFMIKNAHGEMADLHRLMPGSERDRSCFVALEEALAGSFFLLARPKAAKQSNGAYEAANAVRNPNTDLIRSVVGGAVRAASSLKPPGFNP
jgi:hypothetical protein